MVDAVSSNGGLNNLLRAQSAQTSAGVEALRSNGKQAAAVIDQLQKTLNQQKNLTGQLSATAVDTNLPRGSLVDILA